ncbi:unnamed protein product [Dicrocoelium dendriticum]|nr:unnamed protein product [Dicrocoelium dendriticum]
MRCIRIFYRTCEINITVLSVIIPKSALYTFGNLANLMLLDNFTVNNVEVDQKFAVNIRPGKREKRTFIYGKYLKFV